MAAADLSEHALLLCVQDGSFPFIECDGKSQRDTVCVGGEPLARPAITPDVPALLIPHGQTKVRTDSWGQGVRRCVVL